MSPDLIADNMWMVRKGEVVRGTMSKGGKAVEAEIHGEERVRVDYYPDYNLTLVQTKDDRKIQVRGTDFSKAGEKE